MPPSNINELLQDIQSSETEDFYNSIFTKALEWALCGFIEETNELLEALWSYKFEHSEQLRSAEQGLQVLWQVSGTTPSSVPFTFTDIDHIEKENWDNIIYQSGGAIYNTSLQELSGGHLLATAITAAATQAVPTAVILEALDRFIHSNDAVGHAYYQATTAACLIATRNHLPTHWEKYIRLWGQGYLKYWYNYDLAVLLKERTAIPLLRRVILAPVFNLSSAAIQQDIALIKQALLKRITNGRSLLYNHLSWKDLLSSISSIAISQQSNAFSDKAKATTWLGMTGAREEEIQSIEQQLGIQLPEDYREFLLTSNGFNSCTTVTPTIVPVAYIDYLSNYDTAFVEYWIEEVMQGDEIFGQQFRKSIVIGGQGEEQQLLLVPDESGGWECWFFATWALGETRYPSFRFYMESQLKELEASVAAHE